MLLLDLIWATTIIMRVEATRITMEFFVYRRRQLLHLVVVVGFLPVGMRDNAKGREIGARLYKVGKNGSQDQDQDHKAARLHPRISLHLYPRHLLPRHQMGRPQGKEVLLLRQRRQRLLFRPALICSSLPVVVLSLPNLSHCFLSRNRVAGQVHVQRPRLLHLTEKAVW